MSDVVRVGTVEAGPGEKQFGYLTVVERPVTNVLMPVGIINSGRPGPRVVRGTELIAEALAGKEGDGLVRLR